MEMACLGVLWTIGQGTVRDVAEALAPRKAFAYTTVMTLLERLAGRGLVTREKSGRSFVYRAANEPQELREIAVTELTRDYFGGSREELRRWLDKSPAVAKDEDAGGPEPMDTALL